MVCIQLLLYATLCYMLLYATCYYMLHHSLSGSPEYTTPYIIDTASNIYIQMYTLIIMYTLSQLCHILAILHNNI